jgi:TonB-linked SusC/RagA family outer membrane protein
MENSLQKCCGLLMAGILMCLQLNCFSQDYASLDQLPLGERLHEKSVHVKPLKSILANLECQYDVYLNYELGIVENKYASMIAAAGLEESLSHLLKPLGLQYAKVQDNYYAIYEKSVAGLKEKGSAVADGNDEVEDANSTKEFAFYSLRTTEPLKDHLKIVAIVSGSIKDAETGETLPGVSVVIKGTTMGTVSDGEGNYSLDVPAGSDAILVFSSVGYVSQEVSVNNRAVINVSLQADIRSLGEVVVIGYGSVRKSDLTGSVATVSGEDIKRTPITSVDQGLQGRAPGVQVTTTSAAPGGGVSIRVRGTNSINGGSEPLYVIDGFPIYNDLDEGTPAAVGRRTKSTPNPLASINPNDIASIEVLKDASATAIYGSRGANGVVLITTKRGKSGEARVSYEAYYGIQEIRKKLDLLNGREFAEFVNEAYINEGRPNVVFDGVNFPTPEQIGEGTDWQDQIFRTAPMQSHQVSVSGGTENTQYFLSGNYFDQDGIVVGSGFKRGAFRANIDTKVGKRLKIGTSFTASRSRSDIAQTGGDGGNNTGDAIHAAIVYSPHLPVYNPDGTYARNEILPMPDRRPLDNPVAIVKETVDYQVSDGLLANIFADYTFFKGLTFRTSLGVNVLHGTRKTFHNERTIIGRNTNGLAGHSLRELSSWLNENILTYQRTFNDVHDITLMGGFTFQEQTNVGRVMSARGFINEQFALDNLGSGEFPNNPSTSKSKWSLASWLGRINYGLNDKYLFTLTGRADGSSKFGLGNKWAFFPSAAVAWRLIEEDFIQNIGVFADLKLRTSYGITGNSEFDPYRSISRLSLRNYNFGNELAVGIAPSNIPNPNLRWETTTMFDIGLDVGLFDNRLTITTDYYRTLTEDLLLEVTQPYSTGFSSAFLNSGTLQNFGAELGVGGDIFVGDFKWRVDGNISFNRNKVLSLGESSQFFAENIRAEMPGAGQGGVLVKEGEPLGVWAFIIWDGVFQTPEQLAAGPFRSGRQGQYKLGDMKHRDINGDGFVDVEGADRVIVGDPNPNYIFGITNNFSYKNFDLNIFINGVQGNDLLAVAQRRMAMEAQGNQFRKEYLARWTPERPFTDQPRAAIDNKSTHDSKYIYDGSFVRLRNITLGYNFRGKFFQNAKISVTGQNLITISDYLGFDPEVSGGSSNSSGQSSLVRGIDGFNFPMNKTYLLGLNVTF